MKLVKRIVQQMFLFNLFMQKNEKKGVVTLRV